MDNYKYKGISAGAYVEGVIEALSQEEANFKLKEKKIIITNIAKEKSKKKAKDKTKKTSSFSFGKKAESFSIPMDAAIVKWNSNVKWLW